MNKTVVLVSLLLSSVALGFGFKNGNQLLATVIQGNVTVSCHAPQTAPAVAQYTCRDVVLDPAAYDYFVGPVINAAVKVRVNSIHPDGSSRDKNLNYDGAHGISRELANLWIRTLFQYPLLDMGLNTLQYTLLDKQGQSLGSGQWIVSVDRGQPRICQSTFYNSLDPADCSSQYSVCQRYFEQFNNCH